jgi:signal peptidase II
VNDIAADAESVEQPSRATPSSWLTLGIAAAIVVVDQWSKRWALANLDPGDPQHVIWTLQWNLSFNSGMAFGTGEGFGPLIGIIALGVIVWLALTVRHVASPVARVAAGLVVGGAIGNVIDRLSRGDGLFDGAVVDFIDLQWFPWIFNVADMGVTIGGALFIIWSLTAQRAGPT